MSEEFLIFVVIKLFQVDITAHIRELLFGHDCVIVPGFGGFIGNYTPARIDKKSGTFFPPVKQISFNRNLNHNDGLLIGKISGSGGINYGDARDLAGEFAADIRKRLQRGEKVIFDHIGSFVNNQEGNVQFEPDRSSNYYLDSYGLEPFQVYPLEGYDARARVIRKAQGNPERQVSVRKALLRAAVIVPLVAVLIAVPLKTNIFKSGIESTNLNPLVSAELEQNKMAVGESAGTENIKAENNTPVIETPVGEAVVSQPVTESVEVFYLITGSFRSQENADIQVSILKSEGFEPEIVTAPNGFYRVCAVACTDLATAKLKRDSVAGRFPGAWISRKK